MQSCWEILGIERTNDKLEIRKAYRRGWDFGTKKQPTISAKLAKEDALCK